MCSLLIYSKIDDHLKHKTPRDEMKEDAADSCSGPFVGTYTVPLSLSSEFYDFSDTLKISKECRRRMIGLYKQVAAFILRKMQREINEDCRKKGKILKNSLKNKMEERPKRSNTYYRKLFKDSSKQGEISNYLVKNAIMGQYRHSNNKFSRLRKILIDSSFSTIAQFIMCNYVDRDLRLQIASRFNWKLSHVRPQMHGFRRLMERSEEFDQALSICSKNEEFMKLRDKIDTLLRSKARSTGLNLQIIKKILNRFQKYHVLHILLLKPEKIYGIYPKIMKIDGKKYSTTEIEHQLNIFQKFCQKNRKTITAQVEKCITGIIKIAASEVPTVLTRAIDKQKKHIEFLNEKRYGLYHAKRKMKALLALQADDTWITYLNCGVVPSERYLKSLAKLINAIPENRVKSESALLSVVPELFLDHFVQASSISKTKFLEDLLENLTADYCVNVPFTSPYNRKKCSPIDLTPLNHEFLIIRPGKNAQELMDGYLRKRKSVPLHISPSKIISFYTGSEHGKVSEQTLKDFVKKTLMSKKCDTHDIETIINLLSFNEITYVSRRSIKSQIGKMSSFAAFLLNPVLEINIFANRRKKSGLHRIKKMIQNPRSELGPLRILPVSALKKTFECQMILKGPEDAPEFKPSTRFMDGLKVGKQKKELIVGVDINQENEHKLYVAPDWETTEKYIKDNTLEQKLNRRIYNEEKDTSFTTYINNENDSLLVSDRINTLSRELRKNIAHLEKLKKHRKRIQGAKGKNKFHSIATATQFYKDVMKLSINREVEGLVGELKPIAKKIIDIPKHEVHEVARLRNKRNAIIESIIEVYRRDSIPKYTTLLRRYIEIKELGKDVHHLETEEKFNQQNINDMRKEITEKLKRLLSMIMCEKHPKTFVYEDLNVKHQGLKGVLGEATKYMPDMKEIILKASEISNMYAHEMGEELYIKIYATHPYGTSGPPHIPTELDFQRGGKNGWNVVKIPPQIKDEISYPQLEINTHVLACQKLCEKVRST